MQTSPTIAEYCSAAPASLTWPTDGSSICDFKNWGEEYRVTFSHTGPTQVLKFHQLLYGQCMKPTEQAAGLTP